MTYSEQPFNARLGSMGDQAEHVFERISPLGKWERYGWNRPDIHMRNMPPFVRHTPDYCTQSGHLVEVMGLGKDGILKLKLEKWDALREWNTHGPVALFVWNSYLSEWALVRWESLKKLVRTARGRGVESFSDGNQYFAIEWEHIDGAVPYDE